ncbi:hypothetical protein ES708_34884 [subsurface metagenome]
MSSAVRSTASSEPVFTSNSCLRYATSSRLNCLKSKPSLLTPFIVATPAEISLLTMCLASSLARSSPVMPKTACTWGKLISLS